MALGAKLAGFDRQAHGLSINRDDPETHPLEEELADIANECAAWIGGTGVRLKPSDLSVIYSIEAAATAW